MEFSSSRNLLAFARSPGGQRQLGSISVAPPTGLGGGRAFAQSDCAVKTNINREEEVRALLYQRALHQGMKIKTFASALAVAGMLLLASGISWAGSANPPCPQLGFADGCNAIITLNSNGTSTITITSTGAYDGIEDQLVGVINNSGQTVNNITLSGSGIFGFDGDGAFSSACNASGGPAPFPCGAATAGDATGYAGPGTSFLTTDSSNGSVLFSPGLAGNGGTAVFSLEEAPSASGFTVTGTNTATPEPGSVMLFATGILGMAALLWKRKALLAVRA